MQRPFPRFLLSWVVFVACLGVVTALFWLLATLVSSLWFLGLVLVVYVLPLGGLAWALLTPRYVFRDIRVPRSRRLLLTAVGNFAGGLMAVVGWIGIQFASGGEAVLAQPVPAFIASLAAAILSSLLGLVSVFFQRTAYDAIDRILDQAEADGIIEVPKRT